MRPDSEVAVLGLGAAGQVFAEDLVGRAAVTGFDPLIRREVAQRLEARGVRVLPDLGEAVANSRLVLVLTPASASHEVLAEALPSLPEDTVYADLSSGSPDLKRELAGMCAAAGRSFVDATLMAPVAPHRSATPIMAAGECAQEFRALGAALGLNVEVVGSRPGEAAARKLLRSILVKGLTALMIESLRSAEQEGLLDWFSDHAVETLCALDAGRLRGFLQGTEQHRERRVHEMAAARAMAEARGRRAEMTRATVEVLRSVAAGSIPRAGVLADEAWGESQ